MNNIERIPDRMMKSKDENSVINNTGYGHVLNEENKIFVFKNKITENIKTSHLKEISLNKESNTINLTQLLRLMNEKNVSDLLLSTGCKPIMRIEGDIVTLNNFPLISEGELCRELIKIAPERNWEEFNQTNDTDFSFEMKGIVRFRSNIFRDYRGIGVVFRLILVTGPTGSGKSTTLAAMIDHINKTQKKHIVTVEDPIEFVHANQLSMINQRKVNDHTRSFKSALRAALREDPDVILVGEMRDPETIAMEMAVTGHLVLGTLDTSTAIATINRIIDQFPTDQHSRTRAMLSESLIGTVGVSNLIREGKNFQIATLMQTGQNQGMQGLNSVLCELVEKNSVDAEEAISKAIDKESLKTMLRFNEVMKETDSNRNSDKSLTKFKVRQ